MVADIDAFEAEVAPLLPRLRSAARRLVADRSLSEDAVQEALLRAYRFWDRRRGDTVLPWLRQVVVRECWRLLRRQSAEAAVPVTDEMYAATAPPDERAILADEYAEVRRAVERMPEGYRRVLRLRHGHELGEKVIAAILGLPLGTVQWRLKRAHDHLHLVLTQRHTSPLAATLREVTREMEIRVTTQGKGPVVPPPAGVDWSGYIQYEDVSLDQARAAVPAFRLPAAVLGVLAAYPDLVVRLGRRGPDATRGAGQPNNISAHTAVGQRLVIECHVPEYATCDHVHSFPGAEIGIDEDTQVAGQAGHWTKVNAQHNLWWFSKTGAFWRVAGEVPPEEVRRIAEAIEAEATMPTV